MKLDANPRTLLCGLLLPDAQARSHLDQWCRQADLDSVDSATHKLLPLLYKRLVDLDMSSPDLDRLRGVYRKTWYRNQRHLAAAKQATRALTEAAVEVTLVGGLALAHSAYDDLGLRMVDSAEIVVPPESIDRSIESLVASGFTVSSRAQPKGFGLPVGLTHEGGGQVEVREFVYGPSWPGAPDRRVCERRATTQLDRMEIAILSASDAAAETIVSEATMALPGYQWLIDLVRLTQRPESALDWAELIDGYEDTLFWVPISEALELAASELPTGLVPWELPTLPTHPTTKQRAQFWFHRHGRRLARLPAWYRRGIQMNSGDAGFIRFAKGVYDVATFGDAVAKLLRRIRRA